MKDEHEKQKTLTGCEEYTKKGLMFGEVQEHLLKGGSVRRECWNEFPHRAFYCKQIERIIIVDINNDIMQDKPLECQIMANDWEIIV